MRTVLSNRRLTPPTAGVLVALAAAASQPAFAREVKVPAPTLDAAAAQEFPQAIFDIIIGKITEQTSFTELAPGGPVQWSPDSINLAEFVKAPSQTYPDTYLYAMRYLVTGRGNRSASPGYGTSCQVVVVYKYAEYDEPTVVCEPPAFVAPGATSYPPTQAGQRRLRPPAAPALRRLLRAPASKTRSMRNAAGLSDREQARHYPRYSLIGS